MAKEHRWRAVFLFICSVIGIYLATVVLVALIASVQLWQVERQLRTIASPTEMASVLSAAERASSTTYLLNLLTWRTSKTIGCVDSLTSLARPAAELQNSLGTTATLYQQSGEISFQPFARPLNDLSSLLGPAANCVRSSQVLQRILGNDRSRQAATLLAQTEQTIELLQLLLATNNSWIVMFQNTTELRPTGGFTGSYALVSLQSGKVVTINVEDIYDADGQTQRFRSAPPGVAEYTSGDHGLRLTDANWWPDFPTSARTQLDFLAEAGKRDLGGLTAINLSYLQNILRITGPIELPDYKLTLDSQNAPNLLRAHAEDFFPGSIQKKTLLQYTLQQLLLNSGSLDRNKQIDLLTTTSRAVTNGDLQFFFLNDQAQPLAEQLGITNSFAAAQSQLAQAPILAIIEANVGINKSNQFLTRRYSFDLKPETITATLHLRNDADQLAPNLPASQSAYIAYTRLLTTSGLTNQQPGQTGTSWQTADGNSVHDDGQLVTVLPGEYKEITWKIDRNQSQPFIFWHQAGTGPTLVQIRDESTDQQFVQEKHALIGSIR